LLKTFDFHDAKELFEMSFDVLNTPNFRLRILELLSPKFLTSPQGPTTTINELT